ncbi:MAG TPA: HAMP domain-containing sensor histidine kinase [Candidatus Krumholzibacteria bacterium]|nr:HAMP domain-containing sensor histidine kinase [Candidatus Krumholzibacteria bacterium]
MSFRARLAIGFLAGAVVPVLVLGFFVRREMTARLTAQYERRVEALAGVVERDLAAERDAIRAALAPIADRVSDDTRFRRAAVDGVADERRYLLDYAGVAMRLAGLSMLQIQDENGRIVSSGHFRNDYDHMDAELPRLLGNAPGGVALVRARTPSSAFLALASVDTVVIGGEPFWLVGGIEAESRLLGRLSRGEDMRVTLVLPGDSVAAGDAVARTLHVPVIGDAGMQNASIRVSHDAGELHALRASIDRWIVLAALATATVAVLLASLMAARMSRPIVELAEKAGGLDLDRLDADFATTRRDEVGVLARSLGAMTARLRQSASALRDAERRATLGEIARQVNHDIKNGLTPIRNVFRHLDEQAEADPPSLLRVYNARRATIDSGISYLETLAANYAKLSRRGGRPRTNLGDVVRSVVSGRASTPSLIVRAEGPDVYVNADPLALRRIVENLVGNAVDSIVNGDGRVTVATAAIGDVRHARVRLTVADTGAGIAPELLERVFDDFFTTKPDGNGLGLSIVRRLVMDLDGTIALESEAGKGSRFIVELPAAAPEVRE